MEPVSASEALLKASKWKVYVSTNHGLRMRVEAPP